MAPRGQVTTDDKDKGFRKALDAQRKLGSAYVQVGVQGESGLKPKKTHDVRTGRVTTDTRFTVVDVAAVQEFGSDRAGVPERSFLRSAIDKNKRNLVTISKALEEQVLSGKKTLKDALSIIGLKIKADVQAMITAGGVPYRENSPETIARKGSSQPLLDTGQLRASITSVVVTGKSDSSGEGGA